MKVSAVIAQLLVLCISHVFAQEDTSQVTIPLLEEEVNEVLEYQHEKYIEGTESQEEYIEESMKFLEFLQNNGGNGGVEMQQEMAPGSSYSPQKGKSLKDHFDPRRELGKGVKPKIKENVDKGTKEKQLAEPERKMALSIVPSEEEGEPSRRLLGPSQYDSRIETRALDPQVYWQKQIVARSQSVGMIVENTQLTLVTDSVYQLEVTSTLGARYQLCPGEAFSKQPTVGIGTAFVVDEYSMISANHVFQQDVSNYSVVFGFEIINQLGTYEVFIPIENVYHIDSVEKIDLDLDLIQFSTQNQITQQKLEVMTEQNVLEGDEIYMIGFPMGIPQKVAVNAGILSTEYPQHYYTSLDAFRGNSGSPVFDFSSGKVIGVLVSGGSDYEWNGTCNTSVVCNFPQCKGERVSRIEAFLEN